MLTSIEEVKTFLQANNKEDHVYDRWVLEGYKINPELVNSEDVMPEGLHHMSSQDLEALRDNLCIVDDTNRHTTLLIIDLDKSNKSAEELALTTFRWMSHVEYAAMVMVSKFNERILEAEKQLCGTEILNHDAIILVKLD